MHDHLDRIRDFIHAFNRGDAGRLAEFFEESCVTDGVFVAPDAEHPLEGRDANVRALGEFFEANEGGLEGRIFVRIRTLARLETGRGWVHAEWFAGRRSRSGDERPVHQVTGYTHFFVGANDTIEQQRSIVQPAGADASADLPPPPPEGRGSRRYPSRPIVGVGAVILVREVDTPAGDPGRVVLIKRRFEPLAGQWSLPGGALEVGETLEAGTAREILEETGLVVDVGPVIEVFDRILLDEERKVRYHFVLVDYWCRPLGGRLQSGSDVADVALVDPDALGAYGLTPKATSIIRKAVDMARAQPWPAREKELL